MSSNVTVFFAYAREDEELRDKVEIHLSLQKKQSLISTWHDREIAPGKDWEQEIDQQINSANVILLLISADFIDSDYCWGKEMARAMERHAAKEARVIPIIVRPCDWKKAQFGKLQALPRDGRAVTIWGNEDEALADIAAGIRSVVEEILKNPGTDSAQDRLRESPPIQTDQSIQKTSTPQPQMSEDELEISILEKYCSHFDEVWAKQQETSTTHEKCQRELDMGDVIHEITGWTDSHLMSQKTIWFGRLAGSANHRPRKPLRTCSNRELQSGAHRWHAKAYTDGGDYPARERLRNLKEQRADRSRLEKLTSAIEEQSRLKTQINIKLRVRCQSSGPDYRVDAVVIDNRSQVPVWVKEIKWLVWSQGSAPDLKPEVERSDTKIPSFDRIEVKHRGGPNDIVMRVIVIVADPSDEEHEESENNPDRYKIWQSLQKTEFPN
ncbi:toll/interleukin-1 receptor domain-containing protein [Acidobacteria bacterium AH-259-A15]|nr:toll/interleukin-1 receptor domain-containing protein [Acidobacteria bacterium AH-259-A15]